MTSKPTCEISLETVISLVDSGQLETLNETVNKSLLFSFRDICLLVQYLLDSYRKATEKEKQQAPLQQTANLRTMRVLTVREKLVEKAMVD